MSKEEQISDSWEEEFDTFAPLNMGYEPARKRHEEIKSFIKQTLAKQKEEEIAKLKNSGRLMFMEGVKDAKREMVEKIEKLEVMYPERESDEYDAGNEDMRNKVLKLLDLTDGK